MNEALYQAEVALLGSLILNPDLVDECYIQPEEMVADERHKLALHYMKYTYEKDGTISFLNMAERSGKNLEKIGGITYLTQLAGAVPKDINFNHYQAVIRSGYMQRVAISSMQTVATKIQQEDSDIKEQLAAAQEMLERIAELAPKNQTSGLRKMSATLEGHVEELYERKKSKGLTGAPTVSKQLDKLTGGHQRGDLEIVAARPSMGKTAYMNNDAITVARSGRPAAIFSAEMKDRKITERVICSLANLDNNRMRSGAFDDDDWFKYSMARDELDQLPLFIDDTPGMTVQHIRREVKRFVKNYGSGGVIYIDYLQLIEAGVKLGSRQQEVEYVSRYLKRIARNFDVTVVALAQLSRKVEERQDKRPMMSDIREAGGIEQDGDIITFLYRDDYYNKDSEKKNIVELIVAKGRDVGTGTVEMIFLKNYGKFVDHDRGQKEAKDGGKAS